MTLDVYSWGRRLDSALFATPGSRGLDLPDRLVLVVASRIHGALSLSVSTLSRIS